MATDALYTSIWEPRARRIGEESGKLRALTDIGELGAVGLACEGYRRRANDKQTIAEAARLEAASLRDTVQLRERSSASRPGKPTDNAMVESFNGRLRQECPNEHSVMTGQRQLPTMRVAL